MKFEPIIILVVVFCLFKVVQVQSSEQRCQGVVQSYDGGDGYVRDSGKDDIPR